MNLKIIGFLIFAVLSATHGYSQGFGVFKVISKTPINTQHGPGHYTEGWRVTYKNVNAQGAYPDIISSDVPGLPQPIDVEGYRTILDGQVTGGSNTSYQEALAFYNAVKIGGYYTPNLFNLPESVLNAYSLKSIAYTPDLPGQGYGWRELAAYKKIAASHKALAKKYHAQLTKAIRTYNQLKNKNANSKPEVAKKLKRLRLLIANLKRKLRRLPGN